jgi:hypothetical protein
MAAENSRRLTGSARRGVDFGDADRLARLGGVRSSRPLPLLNPTGVPQQKILHDEAAFASRQRSAAGTTSDRATNGFRTGFHLDDLIERIAVRTIESRPASRHKRPHTDFFIVGGKLHSRSSTRNQEATRCARQARPALAFVKTYFFFREPNQSSGRLVLQICDQGDHYARDDHNLRPTKRRTSVFGSYLRT